jgi:alginate O-acetyltransferase complex protein AlgI
VLFRAETLPQALDILNRMFVPDIAASSTVLADAAIGRQAMLCLGIGLLVFFVPSRFVMGPYLVHGEGRPALAARYAYSLTALTAASVLVAAGTFSPFLYYQF